MLVAFTACTCHLQMASVSGLTLESYLQIHKALTKGSRTVQHVTPIEECYYKIADLKQLLQLHGISSSKFNRAELLQALKGKTLINPISDSPNPSTAAQAHAAAIQTAADPCHEISSSLPFAAADLAALSWTAGANLSELLAEQIHLEDVADLLSSALHLNHAAGHDNHTQVLGVPPSAEAAAVPLGTDIARSAHALDAGATQHSTSRHDAPAAIQESSQQLAAYQHAAVAAAPAMRADTAKVQEAAPSLSALQCMAGSRQPEVEHGSTAASLQQQQPSRHVIAAADAALLAAAPAVAAPAPATSVARLYTTQQLPVAYDVADNPVTDVLSNAPNQQQQEQAASLAAQQQQQQQQPQEQAIAEEPGQYPADLLQQAGLLNLGPLASHGHTPWLLQQLRRFATLGAQASHEALPAAQQNAASVAAAAETFGSDNSSAGLLLGRHVGFVLLEDMQVAGARNTLLTLPAGVYEGRVLKYLGSSCQPELCEPSCAGNHQHYRARIMPPQRPAILQDSPDDAALAQAYAAACGRPVLLILDLHPCLRCSSFRDMTDLTATQLQDAWVLLKDRHMQESDSSVACQEPLATADTVPDKPTNRGSQQPQRKRAKR